MSGDRSTEEGIRASGNRSAVEGIPGSASGATRGTIAVFRGGVSCRRESGTPLGLTLLGRSADRPDEMLSVAFSGSAPDGLPEVLEDACVDQESGTAYRIVSESQQWVIAAAAVHVHRDVATVFYRAVAPRPASLAKKIFFSLMLTLAHSATGKRLLLALRGNR